MARLRSATCLVSGMRMEILRLLPDGTDGIAHCALSDVRDGDVELGWWRPGGDPRPNEADEVPSLLRQLYHRVSMLAGCGGRI